MCRFVWAISMLAIHSLQWVSPASAAIGVGGDEQGAEAAQLCNRTVHDVKVVIKAHQALSEVRIPVSYCPGGVGEQQLKEIRQSLRSLVVATSKSGHYLKRAADALGCKGSTSVTDAAHFTRMAQQEIYPFVGSSPILQRVAEIAGATSSRLDSATALHERLFGTGGVLEHPAVASQLAALTRMGRKEMAGELERGLTTARLLVHEGEN